MEVFHLRLQTGLNRQCCSLQGYKVPRGQKSLIKAQGSNHSHIRSSKLVLPRGRVGPSEHSPSLDMDRWSSILLQATSICLDTRPTPKSQENRAKIFPRRAQKISRKERRDLWQGNKDFVLSICLGHQVRQHHPWKGHRLQDPPSKSKHNQSIHTPNFTITSAMTFAAESQSEKWKKIPDYISHPSQCSAKSVIVLNVAFYFLLRKLYYTVNLKIWFHNSHLAVNSVQEGLHN